MEKSYGTSFLFMFNHLANKQAIAVFWFTKRVNFFMLFRR